MKIIVDTNVAVVANRRNITVSLNCVATCTHRLYNIQTAGTIILDRNWHVLREYMQMLRSDGQPGMGDAFLKWILTNQANPQRCEWVTITPIPDSKDGNDFIEFPDDARLAAFDRSDRQFVAIARAHPEHPPILNATDTDWRDVVEVLAKYDVHVEFLCPEEM